MKKIGLILVFLFLGMATAWAVGVRVHPEALGDRFSLTPASYYRLELLNGKTLIGELVKKNTGGIVFKSQRVAVSFSNSEIKNLTPLGKNFPAQESSSLQEPLFTFSFEESFLGHLLASFPGSKQTQKTSSSQASFFDAFTPSVPLNARAHAQDILKKAAASRNQTI